MPTRGHIWRHVTFTTYGTWLPGDRRGFHNREHRIHSSGDHHFPPPEGEHAGLLDHATRTSGAEVHLSRTAQARIGSVLVERLTSQTRLLVVPVSATHVHILAELPAERSGAQRVVGDAKRAASFAVRAELPGRVWTQRSGLRPIRSKDHLTRAYLYIQAHGEEGAWVWTYRVG